MQKVGVNSTEGPFHIFGAEFVPFCSRVFFLAWQCGYYDLAHMIADFRDICGYSPSQLLETGMGLTEAFSPQFSGLMKKKIKIENLV